MQHVKIDRLELASLGAAALFPVTLLGQVASAVGKGMMPIAPQEATFIQLLIDHGIVQRADDGALALSPLLAKAIAGLAGGPADITGAFTEMKPAMQLGMMRLPADTLPASVRI